MASKVNYKPDEYHTVTPYLIVRDADGLLNFIQQVFGVTDNNPMRAPDGKIMHSEVRLGDSVVMLSNSSEQQEPIPAMLHLYIEDPDAAYQRALGAGATSTQEPRNEFYGDRTASVRDRFGNIWFLAAHVEDVSPEEMQRRMEALQRG